MELLLVIVGGTGVGYDTPFYPLFGRRAEIGWGVVGLGALWVGDKLHGYWARLLLGIEGVDWLPGARVREGVWNRVRADVRQRARARAEA